MISTKKKNTFFDRAVKTRNDRIFLHLTLYHQTWLEGRTHVGTNQYSSYNCKITKYKQRSTVYKQVTESQLTNNRRIELPVTNVLFWYLWQYMFFNFCKLIFNRSRSCCHCGIYLRPFKFKICILYPKF